MSADRSSWGTGVRHGRDTERPERAPGSIRRKLAAAFTGVALISVLIVALLGVGLYRLTADRIARQELRRQALALTADRAILRRDLDRSGSGQKRAVFQILRRWSNLSGAALYRLAADGTLVLEAGTDHEAVPVQVLDSAALAAGNAVEGRFRGPEGDLVYVAQPVATGSGRAVVVLSRQAGVGPLLAKPAATGWFWPPSSLLESGAHWPPICRTGSPDRCASWPERLRGWPGVTSTEGSR